jgi:hypothetical protein
MQLGVFIYFQSLHILCHSCTCVLKDSNGNSYIVCNTELAIQKVYDVYLHTTIHVPDCYEVAHRTRGSEW